MSTPLIDVRLDAPVEEVWRHLREPVLVRRWFGWDYEGLEEEIEGIFGEHASVDEAARTIEWVYGPGHADAFALEPDGDATILRATRESPESDGDYDAIAEGWITFLQQLRFALARHPGEERRTLYFSSPVEDAAALPVARALGLGGALDVLPGAAYEADGGPDGRLVGTVWFRTAHQLGVTVDELGDALLVLWEKPSAAAPPQGEASVTISAYGARAAALDEAAERYRAWWSQHLGAPA
jgi:hypothetical protein